MLCPTVSFDIFLDFSLLPFLALVCKELLWEPTLCGLLADPKFNFILTCTYFKFSFSSKDNHWDPGIFVSINISNNYMCYYYINFKKYNNLLAVI